MTLSKKRHKWGFNWRYEEEDVKEAIKELINHIRGDEIRQPTKLIKEIFGEELCK